MQPTHLTIEGFCTVRYGEKQNKKQKQKQNKTKTKTTTTTTKNVLKPVFSYLILANDPYSSSLHNLPVCTSHLLSHWIPYGSCYPCHWTTGRGLYYGMCSVPNLRCGLLFQCYLVHLYETRLSWVNFKLTIYNGVNLIIYYWKMYPPWRYCHYHAPKFTSCSLISLIDSIQFEFGLQNKWICYKNMRIKQIDHKVATN